MVNFYDFSGCDLLPKKLEFFVLNKYLCSCKKKLSNSNNLYSITQITIQLTNK